MHQQPPKTPLFASTSPANASQLDSSRALIVYPDPTITQPSREACRRGRGRGRPDSVLGVTRFVVDCETLLRIAAGEIEVSARHQLVAPTLVRSQALSALYEGAHRGEFSAAEGIERVTRLNSLKVRFLGDKVLQRTAWRVADQLGWSTTY